MILYDTSREPLLDHHRHESRNVSIMMKSGMVFVTPHEGQKPLEAAREEDFHGQLQPEVDG